VTGQRKALIVANDEYDQEGLRNLLAPGADAEALGRVLGDRQIGGFTVQVVRNEPAYAIQAQIEELFSDGAPDDLLLLHFSGHGLKNQSGELFFAASNTRPNRLGSTAISADFVQRCMRASRSRSIVLLLDCCYGGAFARGVSVRAAGDVNVLENFPQERAGGRGRAVITASSAMEYAFEGEHLADNQRPRPSVFTAALVEGLATGDADRDEDGWVSLNELYDYVFDKVREQNPHQTPSRAIEMQGELYLARSRRRRLRPAALPSDLQAAATDPNMYTRLGAVSELRSRLTSDDLPTAAGAYEMLSELARTDTRFIAEPAAEALSRAALQPQETELHFGEQTQGSEPPHRLVRLLGPPIARFCVPHASDDWIRVAEAAEGFDVSVDTGSTGSLSGRLDLKGPTGEAAIIIDINVIPPPGRRSGAASSDNPIRLEEIRPKIPAVAFPEPIVKPVVFPEPIVKPVVFPEPIVIGAIPRLGSEPRGLPEPDQVLGPPVPDSVLDGADFQGLLIRGASRRGDRHRYLATVRQDSMGMWRVGDSETEAVLVCVTDGVSRETLSHLGAAEACRLLRDSPVLAVPDLLKASTKRRIRAIWENITVDLCDRLTSMARNLGVEPKALSTTLAAALIELNPQEPPQRRFVILSVGDAAAFLLKDREFTLLLEDPYGDATTSTATDALPTIVGELGVAAGVMEPGDVLMVCTDGMSNPMRNMDVRAQLAEWWGTGRVPSMAEFGWQLSYKVKTYDDDRTAVCVWGR
jgi:serine/threonine protein phosphatase PrpC